MFSPLTVSLSSVQLLNTERLNKRSSGYHFKYLYDPTENQTQSTSFAGERGDFTYIVTNYCNRSKVAKLFDHCNLWYNLCN